MGAFVSLDHSTANGTAETKHRTVWRQLQGVGIDQHKWLDRLPYVIFNVRTTAERKFITFYYW